MKIESVTTACLPSISQLFISVFSSPPWSEEWELDWAYERLNWLYQSQGFKGYVAQDGDCLIGSIMGHFVPFQGKKGFQIVEFFVHTNYQDRGIGSRLLNQLELNLKQEEYDFMLLLTAKDSIAESFYTKRSYQRDRKIVLLNKEL